MTREALINFLLLPAWLAMRVRARQRIPYNGVAVSQKIVKSHRYLRAHGLPHSERVANVIIPRDLVATNAQ